MRRLFILAPLLLVGCQPGRKAAVSVDGRVASIVASGTYVSGRGRIAEGGDHLAWSPDGQTLAISTPAGTRLWPSGDLVPAFAGPYAWAPGGGQLAGVVDGRAAIRNLGAGTNRDAGLEGTPKGLAWSPDGRLLVRAGEALRLQGTSGIVRKGRTVVDAIATVEDVVWLETPSLARTVSHAKILASPLTQGRWNPKDGRILSTSRGGIESMLGPLSARRIAMPSRFALAADGVRFAVGGIVAEAGARQITRIRALLSLTRDLSTTESAELRAILRRARAKAVVVRFDGAAAGTPVWTAPIVLKGDTPGIEDLAWSPDGKWLAIALKDSTVRVAAGG